MSNVIPIDDIAGRFDIPFDGTSDDGPGLQRALDHLQANGGGRLKLPDSQTPVTINTDLTITTLDVPIIIDAYGATVNYTGSGDMLTCQFTGTAPRYRRPEIHGGHFVGNAAAQSGVRLVDAGGARFVDTGWYNWTGAQGVFWLLNDQFWNENILIENARVVRFSRFIYGSAVTTPPPFESMARIKVVNAFCSDEGQSSTAWIYTEADTGMYDAHISIGGNAGANLTSVFRCGGAWGHAYIDARVEQNVVPTGNPAAYFDMSALDPTASPPGLVNLSKRDPMTVMVPGQTVDELKPTIMPQGLQIRDSGWTNIHQVTSEGIKFFSDQPVQPQQTATDLNTLWTSLANYGLLDAASSAPETPVTTHTWNTPAGSVSVGDRGENFIVPEGGVVEEVAVIADTLVGTDFTVELINATVAFTTNPSVTVTTAGAVVAFGPGAEPVAALDVIYPEVTAINGTDLQGVTVMIKIRHT